MTEFKRLHGVTQEIAPNRLQADTTAELDALLLAILDCAGNGGL
jgi:hypothetical protein